MEIKRLIAPVINVAFQDNSTFRVLIHSFGCMWMSVQCMPTLLICRALHGQVKQARGAIVRHMCLRKATQVSELKSFTGAKC